ncbi:tetratricopeptide repeat protein [Thalassomonas sp. RHCl1]|uniref:tetratricopeptide repeat protein n=1 Tax=Thalassomonas sp. RHCl1 TaxID=2995320 RepID=UPI00248C397E|nr:tetratricopeptide repeat protein [Thalassomonas sp. RHCl1]
MNDLLLSEIKSDEKDLIQSVVLLEEHIFASSGIFADALDKLIKECLAVIEEIDEPLEQVEQLINELFVRHLFLDEYRDFWPLTGHRLESGIHFRALAPSLKVILIHHIITECGFDVDIIYVPEKNMIRVVCDDIYAIIFDPVTGESLNWHELDKRMDDIEGDPSQQELLPISHKSLLLDHITSIKNALIREQVFDLALKCVDVLLAMRPDDPFERRDRGFLLHQLDCFKVAYDDYRFFVEQCPKDPAAQLLKLQLDNIRIADTVIH